MLKLWHKKSPEESKVKKDKKHKDEDDDDKKTHTGRKLSGETRLCVSVERIPQLTVDSRSFFIGRAARLRVLEQNYNVTMLQVTK